MKFDKIYYNEEQIRAAYNNLMILFISAIKSNGGKLTVKDLDIIKANDNWSYHRYNDLKHKQIVFKLRNRGNK